MCRWNHKQEKITSSLPESFATTQTVMKHGGACALSTVKVTLVISKAENFRVKKIKAMKCCEGEQNGFQGWRWGWVKVEQTLQKSSGWSLCEAGPATEQASVSIGKIAFLWHN